MDNVYNMNKGCVVEVVFTLAIFLFVLFYTLGSFINMVWVVRENPRCFFATDPMVCVGVFEGVAK